MAINETELYEHIIELKYYPDYLESFLSDYAGSEIIIETLKKRDSDGDTLLFLHSLEIALVLLKALPKKHVYSSLAIPDSRGNTLLDYACAEPEHLCKFLTFLPDNTLFNFLIAKNKSGVKLIHLLIDFPSDLITLLMRLEKSDFLTILLTRDANGRAIVQHLNDYNPSALQQLLLLLPANHYELIIKDINEYPIKVFRPVSLEEEVQKLNGVDPFVKIAISDQKAISAWAQKQGFDYIPTQDKKKQAVEQSLAIGSVALLGRASKSLGVYNVGDVTIKKGTVLGTYEGERKPFSFFEKGKLDYVYRLDDDAEGEAIDAHKKRNWTAMVNSASSESIANVYGALKNGQIIYIAKNNIKPGRQLLIYYGDDYEFDINVHRFLRTENTWLDSYDIYLKYSSFYEKPEKWPINLRGLIHVEQESFFLKPKISKLNSETVDLPLLFFNGQTREMENQDLQENPTLLMLACWEGNYDLVERLLKIGANPNIQSSISGLSVIHFIAAADLKVDQKIELLTLLLTYGLMLRTVNFKLPYF
ncbi:SET domain-containing protein-lysine N-methyltransferase [Legionella sp. km772]|uniref:SET domain-containing protein-lysine N-methyltransferase n=1 Tax=Legionella sp. km772 TaxID=2498111 RepID=UPI000F8C5769|nr:SET domain-containing protein-lysine N-methyltransferase [Legionella sp. km772]RUR05828.1 hypothetical protein ELY15_13860 [Legionella sp. km772]